MKIKFFQRFRFSEIRKDKWLESVGKLSKEEMGLLKKRSLVFAIYRVFKFLVMFPVSLVIVTFNGVRVLNEFERLHFSPLRKIHRGNDCVIDRQTLLVNGQNIYLGDFVKISAFSSIIAGNESKVTIGTNTIIAPGVTIVALNHGIDLKGDPIRYQKWKELSITIENDVWIAANVVILPGTVIGAGSIIGAGVVVKGEIPSNTVIYIKNGSQIRVPRR